MSENDLHNAGVAAGHTATVDAAHAILAEGGNAFDAAIGGFLAACVAEPVLASLGGGGFLVARKADGEVSIFDFFTETPLRRPDRDSIEFFPIEVDFGPARQEFHIGLGAVATPGAVAGVFAVHNALGHMSMAELVAPAQKLARDGIILNPFQAYLLDVVGPIYQSTDSARAQFCTGGAGSMELLKEGGWYRPHDFDSFLGALAEEGEALFYKGEIAQKISQMEGCAIGMDDLNRYRVVRRKPLVSHINGYDVFLNPPPAIGGALIDFNLRSLDVVNFNAKTAADAHYPAALCAVMDACNKARRESGIDSDPIAGASALSAANVHPPAYRGTTHISVADAAGNLAALTVSNGEGCGHVVPGTGTMLNNMLGEDDLNAAGFFQWPEGVRLSSMMTPGIMVSPDGAWTAFGSGGSNRIRSALTQIIANLCIFGMAAKDAIKHPRLHVEGRKLSLEPGLDASKLDWHGDVESWPDLNMFFGGVHVVTRDCNGRVSGAGDLRRDGVFRGA